MHQAIVLEALNLGLIQELRSFKTVLREVRLGGSRIDLMVDEWALEIKGCILVKDGPALFPKATTERGRRHVHELARFAKGIRAFVFFLTA